MRGRRAIRWIPCAALFVAACGLFGTTAFATPVGLRVEQRTNPLGVDSLAPVLSWRSDAAAHNWVQTAYELEVASSPDLLRAGKPDVWDSGRTQSA